MDLVQKTLLYPFLKRFDHFHLIYLELHDQPFLDLENPFFLIMTNGSCLHSSSKRSMPSITPETKLKSVSSSVSDVSVSVFSPKDDPSILLRNVPFQLWIF